MGEASATAHRSSPRQFGAAGVAHGERAEPQVDRSYTRRWGKKNLLSRGGAQVSFPRHHPGANPGSKGAVSGVDVSLATAGRTAVDFWVRRGRRRPGRMERGRWSELGDRFTAALEPPLPPPKCSELRKDWGCRGS